MTTISIITPTYNNARYLPETIESICSQEGKFMVEYIIMDGGSSDNTVEILKKFEQKFRDNEYPNLKSFKWVSEQDNGQTHAINKGISQATGEIIGYLNSDDTLTQNSLSKVVKFFEEKPEASWLTGRCHIIDEENQVIQKPITWYKNFWLQFDIRKILHVLNPVSQPSTFWKRSLHSKTGLFNESEHLVMDYEFWLRISQISEMHVTKEYLSNFRIHNLSKGSTEFRKQFQREHEVSRLYPAKHASIVWDFLHIIHNFLVVTAYKMIK